MSEVNFDGLVGPTHNYAGLAYGNTASTANAKVISNPKLAAQQGLDKMRLLMELGVPQAVFPPPARPNLHLLHTLGFSGTSNKMIQAAYKTNPDLLAAVFSASAMWVANAATISPSCDTADNKVNITPANLAFNLHRAQECEFNHKLLQKIFHDPKYFVVHDPIPADRDLSDEGAANHSVLCEKYNRKGLELFVYGRLGLDEAESIKHKFVARQTKLASTAVAMNHKLDLTHTIFLQQSPEAIDAGVFHNDVVFVANKNVMLYHEQAFTQWDTAKEQIKNLFADKCYFIPISKDDLSLEQAVATYLFNSQIVSVDEDMILIAPYECKESVQVRAIISKILAGDNPIKNVIYVECKQSMQNGGGPACLRLRAILTPEQQAACWQNIFLTPELYKTLHNWIEKHYRDRLSPQDLLDPQLLIEVQSALEELTQILALGNLYNFQSI